jgi:hypothetical protein
MLAETERFQSESAGDPKLQILFANNCDVIALVEIRDRNSSQDRGGRMPDLHEIYSNGIKQKYGFPPGWFPNWPPGSPRKLGDVGTVESPGFNRDGVVADYALSATPEAPDGKKAGPWNLSSSKSIKVTIGTNAALKGWEWIGAATAGVKIGFGTEAGMIMGIGSSWYEKFQNLDKLRADLLAQGRAKKIAVGKSVIVERLFADTGLSIVSEGVKGTMQATTTFDAGVGKVPALASFAAGFHAVTQQASYTSETHPDGFCVAFRVITLGKRGWFFGREPYYIAGATGSILEPSIDILEKPMGPEDYWAAYSDAVFDAEPKKSLPEDGSSF